MSKQPIAWFTRNGKHIPIYADSDTNIFEEKKNREIENARAEAEKRNNGYDVSASEILDAADKGSLSLFAFTKRHLAVLEKQHYKEFDGQPSGKGLFGNKEYDEESSNQVGDYMLNISNADKLIEQIKNNPKDYDAFEDWSMGFFMDGQQYRGFNRMTELDQQMTRIYDKYLDKATLNEGITVVRRSTPQLLGLPKYSSSSDLESYIQMLYGRVIECKGNMSTSCAKEALHINNSEPLPIEYRIHIPKGSKGAGMWIGDRRINDEWGSTQREFMTNRDILFAIGSYEKDTTIKNYDRFIVNLYYLGRKKHEY